MQNVYSVINEQEKSEAAIVNKSIEVTTINRSSEPTITNNKCKRDSKKLL
ncbi:757_t:CDS:1, partial [Cetraspora pellucida]